MKKIDNFNTNANEVSDFVNLKPGIYVCKIMGVEDVSDKEYLKVYFDIVKSEKNEPEYVGFFQKMYDSNKEYGWGISGTTYRSYKESARGFFERFITVIRKSNPNFNWNWNENILVNKMFIGIFQEEEYLNDDNELKTSVKLQEMRSIEAYKNGDVKFVEKKKEIDKKNIVSVKQPVQQQEQNPTIYDISDDDLPF